MDVFRCVLFACMTHVDEENSYHCVHDIRINIQSKRNHSVEIYHEEKCKKSVTKLSTSKAFFSAHDEKIILVNDFYKSFSRLLDLANTIKSIILPCTLNDLTVWIRELAISMFDIVNPLALICDCSFSTGNKDTVSMSNIYGPITIIIGAISPLALSKTVSFTHLVSTALVGAICINTRQRILVWLRCKSNWCT